MKHNMLLFIKDIIHKIRKNFSTIILWDVSVDNAKARLLTVGFGFTLFFGILSYRLIIVAMHNYVQQNQYQTKNKFRKEIVDRNGTLLAVNIPSASLFVNPQKIINPKKSLGKLSKILPGTDTEKLLAELNSDKTFIWIKRDLHPKEQEAVTNLGLPGFECEQEQKRIYTYSNLLAHVIGYVGRDLNGLAGLERTYDKFLTNMDPDIRSAAQLKKPLELSIDVRLQNILDEEISKTLKEFNAIGAVGVIVNPYNGEILAYVNKPDFNPHYPSLAKDNELFNRASHGTYEMGSIFKILTMAVAFDTNSITMNDAYDLSYMKVGGFNIKDYHKMQGWHSVPEIFLHSSNIGVSQIIFDVGKSNFKQYLKKLGLLDQLKIELPEKATPLFPSDKRWGDLATATMSYGYGISISPLHFIRAILPVVNGGILYDLTFLKRKKEDRFIGTRVFREETSKRMKELLRLVVKEGTGRKAEVKGYLVGGKTGTAEKLSAQAGLKKRKYLKNSRMSSFLGIFPIYNPQYLIYIMFDEPKGIKETFGFATAGWTAAPTAGRVIERMVALYGMEAVEVEQEVERDI